MTLFPAPLPLSPTRQSLGPNANITLGTVAADLVPDAAGFEALWGLRPDHHATVVMMGREVEVPRWQRAYGRDYRFAGNISESAPVPAEFEGYLQWARNEIDPRMNGLLVNWYDAALGHYIGKHRDQAQDLVPGAPIVSVSLGASRTFRMRPWRSKGFQDFAVHDGMYVRIPYETNKRWTHEVPLLARDTGRRISVTIRAFGAS